MDGLDSKCLKGRNEENYLRLAMMIRGQRNVIVMRGSKIQNLTGYFQRHANLDTGEVAGYYYNTHTRVIIKNPSSNQVSDDETSLLN